MEKDWFDIALKHFDEANYSQALFAITKYIKDNPNNNYGKILRAVICRTLSNYDLSLAILKEIEPTKNADENYKKSYYRELGDTYNAMGNHTEAIIWYDKFIELCPNETMGYIFKGGCLAAAGQYKLAKEEHLKATTLEGDREEAFYNLALIYRAEMNFSQAKLFCEKSLEIDPNDEGVRHCLDDIIETIKLTDQYGS